MNILEKISGQNFPFETGQKLTELVKEFDTVYAVYLECRYPQSRSLFKISSSDKDLRQLFSVIKPNGGVCPIFKYVGAITHFEQQTGRKFYKLLLLCALNDTNLDSIEYSINDLAYRMDNVWNDISRNDESTFIGCIPVTEVNEAVLRKLSISPKKTSENEESGLFNKKYDNIIRQYKNTTVMRISLHVPFNRPQVLTEKDFDLFYETLDRALISVGKSDMAGQLHTYRHENNAGCFDVVLFFNGDEIIPGQDSFMNTMGLVADAWHDVTGHRFVISHFAYVTNKEQEAKTSALKKHIINPLRGIVF